jgi:hypothetical protein
MVQEMDSGVFLLIENVILLEARMAADGYI